MIELLKDHIKTKSWFPDNFDDIFYVKNDILYVKTYKFDKWKELFLKGYKNDDLINYFRNFIEKEIPELNKKYLTFLYDKKPLTNYISGLSNGEGIGIPFTIR